MAKFFSPDETHGLNPLLVSMLDDARERAGIPFVITSGFRDPAQNASAGGVEDSAHSHTTMAGLPDGFAVDIRVPDDSRSRFHILKGLFGAGFCRVGIYDKHVHVDIDPSKPQFVCWTGESH